MLQNDESNFFSYQLFFVTFIFGLSILFSCKNDQTVDKEQRETFIKFFGSYQNDNGSAVIQSQDLGYVIVGTLTQADNQTDIYVIKTDIYGNETWKRTFGSTFNDEGKTIAELDDGNIIVAGNVSDTTSEGLLHSDILLIKLTKTGNTIWEQKYGASSNETVSKIVISNNLNITLIGSTTKESLSNQNPEGMSDLLFFKTNANGTTLWSRQYGGAGNDFGASLIQKTDSNFVLVGSTKSFSEYGQAGYNALVVETNKNGILTNSKTFGGMGNDYANDICLLPNGDYAFVGTTVSMVYGNEDVYLVRVGNNIQQLVYNKVFGGIDIDEASSICVTNDQQIAILGTTKSFNLFTNDIYLIKTDLDGNEIFSMFYGDEGDETGNSIKPTSDKGFIFAGASKFKDNSMILLIKTNAEGELDVP